MAAYSFVFQAYVGDAEAIAEQLRDEARAATARYPQYAGKYDGHRLGRLTRTVKTKMGVAGEKGDLVIYCDDVLESSPVVSFWSRSNKIDTLVSVETIQGAA